MYCLLLSMYTGACIHVYAYIHPRICIHMYAYIHMYIELCVERVYVCMYITKCVCI